MTRTNLIPPLHMESSSFGCVIILLICSVLMGEYNSAEGAYVKRSSVA